MVVPQGLDCISGTSRTPLPGQIQPLSALFVDTASSVCVASHLSRALWWGGGSKPCRLIQSCDTVLSKEKRAAGPNWTRSVLPW